MILIVAIILPVTSTKQAAMSSHFVAKMVWVALNLQMEEMVTQLL